jgi:alkylation response protein AidB-like acyl-CoA dehydrogenase
MSSTIEFDPIRLPPEAEELRTEVRAFLKEEIAAGTFDPHSAHLGGSFNPEFSRKVGDRGWIGLTWPKEYGGQERSFLERYVVTEEFRVSGAPTRAHFTADRQSGPMLLKYAPDEVKQDIVPRITRGECYFCIGMSEPDSGSDLFAAKTKAEKTADGWLINGRKVWTSNAHRSHYMIGLFRTSSATDDNRRHGLTQFLVDMSTPGITVRPLLHLTGNHEFNEVIFEDALLPENAVLGEVDSAWKQATSELAYERSGPERFLETIYILPELVNVLGKEPDVRGSPRGKNRCSKARWSRTSARTGNRRCRRRPASCRLSRNPIPATAPISTN